VTSEVDSSPLDGIQVRAFDAGTLVPAGVTSTAADGTYSLDGLSDGSYLVRFSAPADGWAPEWYKSEYLRSNANAVVVSGSDALAYASLAPGYEVSGQITGEPSNVPVPNPVVYLRGSGQNRRVVADAAGNYIIRDVPNGEYVVFVIPGDGSAWLWSWYVQATKVTADSVPVFGGPVTVNVTLPLDGTPT